MSEHLSYDYNSGQRRGDEKEFPKTSFDRIGDDLSELILNYLPLEDKFRFECLNRRIQSLIYTKESQFALSYDFIRKHITHEKDDEEPDFEIKVEECDFNTLIVVLKKLKAINSIGIESFDEEINGQLLITIADHCKHLTSLDTYSGPDITTIESEEAVEYFGQKLGHKLKNLDVSEFTPEAAITLLKLTPNLESLRIGSDFLDILWSEWEIFLPKLKDLCLGLCGGEGLNELHRHYGQTITSLSIILYIDENHGSISEESLQVMKELSKFNRLTDLRLKIISSVNGDLQKENKDILYKSLLTMFEGMSNLKRLVVNNGFNRFLGFNEESDRFIKLLTENKQLTATDVLIRLEIIKPDSWIGDEDSMKEILVKEIKDYKLDKYFVSMNVYEDADGFYGNRLDVNIKFRKNCD